MTDEELRALVKEVQVDLEKHLSVEHENLKKAHPGEESSAELPSDESATSDSDGSASPPAEESSSPPADASPAAAPAADESAPPADAPPADASAEPATDPGVIDPAAIEAELSAMPPEHVKALYLAAKKVIFASMGAGADGPAPSPDASAPPPPAAAPPAPAPDASPALKSEKNPANGGKVVVAKSEQDMEIEALRKKVTEFEGIASGLMTVVEKVISVPPRKAVTGVSQLSKSAEDVSTLSKSEINERLGRAARTKLSKSDRELINQYSVGAIDVSKVKHLLDVK
jgi:hypothetical protein